MRIAVCIITFKRPRGIRAALEALAAQEFPAAPPDLRVVVVDNDAAESARPVIEELRAAGYPWPLEYAIETQQGIPFARNRCVAIARPQVDWICFIDDDEEAAPGWLAELIRVQAEYQADIVTGPVVPQYDGEVPDWAEKGKFFDRIRFETGHRRDRAFTNNIMIRGEVFDRVQPHFDERMAATGGSDAHFSRRANKAGFKIIYANEAEVFETFPVSRMTKKWVYQRAYRIGTANAWIARDINKTKKQKRRAVTALVKKAATQIVGGGALAAAGLVAGRHVSIQGIREVCGGAGIVVGLFGVRYEEYRQTHGS